MSLPLAKSSLSLCLTTSIRCPTIANSHFFNRKFITMPLEKTHPPAVILLAICVIGLNLAASAQEILPSPPPDHSFVYYLNSSNELAALPFELGMASLNYQKPAKETRVGFIELDGAHASTVFETANPRIFLFASQRAGSHPPFLVLLSTRRGKRRVTAVAQQGMSGFAIASEQIIKPNLRVLASLGEEVFMEIRPRVSLIPGEYAIIGNDVARIATFRISAGKQ